MYPVRTGFKWFLLRSRTHRGKQEKGGQGWEGGERREEQGRGKKEKSSDHFF